MNPTLGGLILAGGQGSRMGYVNKGLQPWFTGRLIHPALHVLQQECAHVAISANQDVPHYQAMGVEVWPDAPQWVGCGPLAGVISSVAQFPKHIETIQIVPCDAPLLSTRVVKRLNEVLQDSTAPAVYAQTRSQTHPVICQLRRETLVNLAAFLQQTGKHSIRRWLMQLGAEAVRFEDESEFANVNDVATLKVLQMTTSRKECDGLDVI